MELKILPLPFQYIFSLLFVINNMEQFTVNSEVYHIGTRQHSNLHIPLPNLTKYQKGVYYLGVKIFNVLPSYIKQESKLAKVVCIPCEFTVL
jgi:hypothetical protein